jgi:hypothetical protein
MPASLRIRRASRTRSTAVTGFPAPTGPPGPSRCGIDARSVQDLPHRGRGDDVPEPRQLALDPPVAPGRVLPRHPDDQRPDRGPGGRPSWPTPAGVVPLAGDKVPVPAQDRGRVTGKTSAHRRRLTSRDNAASQSRSA